MLQEFSVIAGPCALESSELNLKVGIELAKISQDLKIPIIFKASFDKANRSRVSSARGPGLKEGLVLLSEVKRETSLPILTDIHEPYQAREVAKVADIIQIPAFLVRQTDLLLAAGETGKPVNIKKSQWMSVQELKGALGKVRDTNTQQVIFTERGTFFGYGDLVVDMRNFQRIEDELACPVYFDGTHSVQKPGQHFGSTGGESIFTRSLVLAAVGAGCGGLFLEVHPNPASAPSDRTTMMPLNELRSLLERVLELRSVLQ